MSLHKLSAGNGYEYLTKQVAAMDATDKGKASLADYYSAKGETPGRWMGRGLRALAEVDRGPKPRENYLLPARPDSELRAVEAGSTVSAEQMKALFGEGRHPNADAIVTAFAEADTGSADAALAASKLGKEFAVYTDAPEFVVRLAERYTEYNKSIGERWNTVIDPAQRAVLRTELAAEMFEQQYGRAPADDREATSFITAASRPKPSSVAGYDLTFSPVKSVSALWAIAPREMADKIEQAHHAAVDDAMAFIEDNATLSRLGTAGVAQVDTDGLIAAAFTHRDSRAGDPDLHTHVTVSNKVRVTDASGIKRWMALDGRPLHKAAVTASELYNTALEAHCRRLLGVDFADVVDELNKTKRPVREIVGMAPELLARWSSRRVAIQAKTDELAVQFQADHGREPTTTEALDLAQQATLATRDVKHEPRSFAQQRATWRDEALAVFRTGRFAARGRSGQQQLSAMIAETTTTPVTERTTALTADETTSYAAQALDTISAGRARWQRPHIRAEAYRLLRANETFSPTDLRTAVEAVTDEALGPDHVISCASDRLDGDLDEPEALRRADGASVYTTHDTDLFTTEAIVAAEHRIIAAAKRTDGRTISTAAVDIALLEQAANDRELNPGQVAMVRALATSGRRVHVALAPAGTGKTTAMRALSAACGNDGVSVTGFAPTAAAAAVLRDELGTQTDTLAKFVDLITADRRARETPAVTATPHAVAATSDVARPSLPDWYTSLGRDSLIVIDEAGMAGTADLDTAISHILATGASVRLVGDDQQLASISAGGVLRDVAHETGALTLSEVVRFRDPAEGSASLALRDGDPAALGFYADHHRIHIAADAVAADQVYTAWTADRAAGKDSVMLAPTRETVNALNDRARTDRLAADRRRITPGARRTVGLSDGLQASVGDIVCTRRNRRQLQLSATDWVRNGDRWEVTEVARDGRMKVRHLDLDRTIVLPDWYVQEFVTLGYASTIHAEQGSTADTCHVVGSDMLTKQLLYVAMTRGREGNHVYFSTAESDPHKVTTPKSRTPDTGLEVLTAVLGRDGSQQSATTTTREAADPLRRIAHAAHAYDDALGSAAEHRIGAQRMAEIDAAAAAAHPGLTEESAWPVLRKHLATLEVGGADAITRLTSAIGRRELDTALDAAAVIDWRLDVTGTHSAGQGPLPWLPAIPTPLAELDTWGPYLGRRSERVTELAAAIAEATADWTPATAPRWARPYLVADADPALIADLAVFRAVMGVDDTDRRPTGPDQYAAAPRRYQQRLDARATAVVDTHTDTARWNELADRIDPQLRRDPYWPELAEQFSAASRAGLDIGALATEAADTSPLPTEMPAAALWWRLSGDLAPATLDVADSGIRPDWINDVATVLGERAAAAVISDPAWPGLVTAIGAATSTSTWTPRELLDTANELIHADVDGDHTDTVRLDEYARALTWRIDLLASLNSAAELTPLPVDEPLSPEMEEAAATVVGVGPDTHPDLTDTAHELDTRPDDAAVTAREAPADLAVDDSYLAALYASEPADLDAAPEYDGPPPEVDHYDDLGFDDLTDARPLPAPTLTDDVAVLIADRYEILARLAETTDELAAIRTQLSYPNTGPHETAAMPQIMAMRERQAAQRDTAVAADTAHAEWVDADRAVEDLTTARAELLDLAAEARLDDDPDQAVRYEADAELVAMQIEGAQSYLDEATARLADARAAHAQVCAGTGGPVVDRDIDTIRILAQDLDGGILDDARARRDALATAAWRIEHKLARHHATTHTADHDQAIDHDLPATTDPAAEPMAPAADAVAAAEDGAAEVSGLRAVADGELDRRIAAARNAVTRFDNDLRQFAIVHRGRGHDADAVQTAHDELAATSRLVDAALAAAQTLDAARTAHAHTTAELTAATRALEAGRRRDRPALRARVDALTLEVAAATDQVNTARGHAEQAAAATGIAPGAWATTLARAADTATLSSELDAARRRDATVTTVADRARTHRAAARADLAALLDERRRRSTLTPQDRDRENHLRTPTPNPPPEPAPSPSLAPRPGHAPAPDPGPDLGHGL